VPCTDVRVAILSDVGLISDALAASLAARPQLASSGVLLPNQIDLLIRLAAARPDVVIVDADADNVDLPRTITDVFRASPDASVVVIGDQPDASTAVAAVRAGAAAWCDRATSVERLVDVLLGVHHREAWFPPRLLREILCVLAAPASDQPDGCGVGDDARGVLADEHFIAPVISDANSEAAARNLPTETAGRRAHWVRSASSRTTAVAPLSGGSMHLTAPAGVPAPPD